MLFIDNFLVKHFTSHRTISFTAEYTNDHSFIPTLFKPISLEVKFLKLLFYNNIISDSIEGVLKELTAWINFDTLSLLS